jgi:hypothetical protein
MARTSRELVICVKNEGYSVSLERRKLYVALADAQAAKHGQLRVIDESGEDYLSCSKSDLTDTVRSD